MHGLRDRVPLGRAVRTARRAHAGADRAAAPAIVGRPLLPRAAVRGAAVRVACAAGVTAADSAVVVDDGLGAARSGAPSVARLDRADAAALDPGARRAASPRRPP